MRTLLIISLLLSFLLGCEKKKEDELADPADPRDAIIGTYAIKGDSFRSLMNEEPSHRGIYIDTIELKKVEGNRLDIWVKGWQLEPTPDRSYYVKFYGGNGMAIQFHGDTLIYFRQSGGPGGGDYWNAKGLKIK